MESNLRAEWELGARISSPAIFDLRTAHMSLSHLNRSLIVVLVHLVDCVNWMGNCNRHKKEKETQSKSYIYRKRADKRNTIDIIACHRRLTLRILFETKQSKWRRERTQQTNPVRTLPRRVASQATLWPTTEERGQIDRISSMKTIIAYYLFCVPSAVFTYDGATNDLRLVVRLQHQPQLQRQQQPWHWWTITWCTLHTHSVRWHTHARHKTENNFNNSEMKRERAPNPLAKQFGRSYLTCRQ